MGNDKTSRYVVKHNEDTEHVRDVVSSLFPSCSSADFISVVCYPFKKHDSVDEEVESKRLSDLFFKRIELAIRKFTGCYEISKEEAISEVEKFDEISERTSNFLNLHHDSLKIRYRRLIGRSKKYQYQAEIKVNNDTGTYYIYVNLCPNTERWFYWDSITVFQVEKDPNFGLHVVFTVVGNFNNNFEKVTPFTELLSRQFGYWLDSGKKADSEIPLRQVDERLYYDNLLKVHEHEVVKNLSEKWNEYEKTDKSKHLFEDVGITSYLATLFDKLQLEKVSFVDLGCGNGVNTYLLNSLFGDKIKGVGYDLKERKIWKYYQQMLRSDSSFKVEPLTPEWPNLKNPFPKDTNFIVGIHTDELTPWIPLYAMMNKCNFFIMPCCPWDFYGKFSKPPRHKIKSSWPYLDHIISIGEKLGFEISIDTLKIPAEKRIGIIGRIPSDGKLLIDKNERFWALLVDQLLTPSLKANSYQPFKIREPQDNSRDFSKMPRDETDKIVSSVVKILDKYGPEEYIPVAQIVKELPEEITRILKAHNGGLYTFLKIMKNGFILKDGRVSARTTVYEKYLLPNQTNVACFFEKFRHGCNFRDICGFKHNDSYE